MILAAYTTLALIAASAQPQMTRHQILEGIASEAQAAWDCPAKNNTACFYDHWENIKDYLTLLKGLKK